MTNKEVYEKFKKEMYIKHKGDGFALDDLFENADARLEEDGYGAVKFVIEFFEEALERKKEELKKYEA